MRPVTIGRRLKIYLTRYWRVGGYRTDAGVVRWAVQIGPLVVIRWRVIDR